MKKREHIFDTVTEWREEGNRRYGEAIENWKFKCPRCGAVSTVADFVENKALPDAVYCECIGVYDKSKGCDYVAYGFLDLCTTEVAGQPVFDFA